MLPISELQVAACGLATLVATVGYQYVRNTSRRPAVQAFNTRNEKARHQEGRHNRRSSTSAESNASSSSSGVETNEEEDEMEDAASDTELSKPLRDCRERSPTPGPCLKRKISESPEPDADSDAEAEPKRKRRSITPPKASTPELEPKPELEAVPSALDNDTYVVVHHDQNESQLTQAASIEEALSQATPAVPPSSPPRTLNAFAAFVDPASPFVTAAQSTPSASNSTVPQSASSPASSIPVESESPAWGGAAATTGPSAFSSTKFQGFAAFAGTQSPFASPSEKTAAKPAWVSGSNRKDKNEDVRSEAVWPNAIGPAVTPPPAEKKEEVEPQRPKNSADFELKGAKLFVKRGDRDFTSAVPGTIALQFDARTMEERLVFRREPIWKVSMNVRLRTGVRATYDAAERVLRVALLEPAADAFAPRQEVVVYAIKAGRMDKRNLDWFAQMVVESPWLVMASDDEDALRRRACVEGEFRKYLIERTECVPDDW